MGSLSIWHWVVVAVIVMMLFGRGKVSELMGDVAKGIKAFKKGMAEDEETPKPQPPVATMPPGEPVRTIPHQGEPNHAPAQPTGAPADRRVS